MDVHPVAALFPMLPDDELDELAADIQLRGLLQPIVLSADGTVLIDGRNRLEACRRAHVQPAFVNLNGEDPLGFILASNVTRRHLSKGQRVMATSMALRVSGKTQQQAAKETRLSQQAISNANVVLDWAPELGDAVLNGATPLDYAYQQAQDRKKAAESTTAQMDRLQRVAPDLAQLVVEERMVLSEALAAEREREERDRQHRQLTTRLVSQALRVLDPVDDSPAALARRLDEATDVAFPDDTELTAARLKAAAAVLTAWAKLLPGRSSP